MEKKLLDTLEAIGRVLGLVTTVQSGHTAVLTRWSSSSKVFKNLVTSEMKERTLQCQETDGGHARAPQLGKLGTGQMLKVIIQKKEQEPEEEDPRGRGAPLLLEVV